MDALDKACDAFEAEEYGKAFEIFQRRAAKNCSESQYYLGLMYRDGLFVDRDENKAVYWWKKAARNQNVSAAFALQEITMTTSECCR